MKRSNEESQDNKPPKKPRLQREIQWNKEKFEAITTHGIKIMPKNISKYEGCISYETDRKKWRLRMRQIKYTQYKTTHETREEAEQHKIEISTSKNLAKNIIYIYENEYYCVLTQQQVMKFSVEDIDIVDKYVWCAMLAPDSMSFYASSNDASDGGKTIKFHRLLFPNIEKGMTVDHINITETLDNTRSNLRLATRSMQLINQRLRLDNKSGVKGVRYNSSGRLWSTLWTDDEGHKHQKHFGISKYGEAAKEKAIEYRKYIEQVTARYNWCKKLSI